jgi:hypothetical protein
MYGAVPGWSVGGKLRREVTARVRFGRAGDHDTSSFRRHDYLDRRPLYFWRLWLLGPYDSAGDAHCSEDSEVHRKRPERTERHYALVSRHCERRTSNRWPGPIGPSRR